MDHFNHFEVHDRVQSWPSPTFVFYMPLFTENLQHDKHAKHFTALSGKCFTTILHMGAIIMTTEKPRPLHSGLQSW